MPLIKNICQLYIYFSGTCVMSDRALRQRDKLASGKCPLFFHAYRWQTMAPWLQLEQTPKMSFSICFSLIWTYSVITYNIGLYIFIKVTKPSKHFWKLHTDIWLKSRVINSVKFENQYTTQHVSPNCWKRVRSVLSFLCPSGATDLCYRATVNASFSCI